MKHKLIMGPSAIPEADAVPKFWNMASINDEEGEITLYGDVVSQQPVDWWAGEPEPGLYITPEGFMEDLAAVRNKSRITVKLNSCGGDLYTGIAIHNALKSLSGQVNIIVEGIAASAASVIMCAGDSVDVYPGSLIMIHGVSVHLWDTVNIQDMKQLIKGMDASERAVAEIYSGKTGLDTDTLRNMMTKETWMTGREAVEKGFADVLKEDGSGPDMSMSADRKILYVNGIGHSVEGMRNVPETIPVQKQRRARPAAGLAADKGPANKAAQPEGGKNHMTLEELKAQEPDLVSRIEQDARNAAQAQTEEAVKTECERLAAIDSIAASIPDQQMVRDAKYGENPCTAQELCFAVMQKSAALGQKFLENYAKDGQMSNTAMVGAAPNGGNSMTKEEQDAADIQAVVNAYTQNKGGTK